MSTDETNTALRRRTLLTGGLAALAAAAALGGPALAFADPVDLSIVDRETGQAMRTWNHDGRRFIAGRTGSRYALRVTNNTAGRVLVVLSVDGVNIVSGETAGVNQRGYILAPYRSYDLTGWRKSTSEIAAFTFAPLSRSYAARTGRPTDVGVIGMAVFNERYVPPVVTAPPVSPPGLNGRNLGSGRTAAPPSVIQREELEARGNPSAADQASGYNAAPQRAQEQLGTGHGQIERSYSSVQPFQRASSRPFFTAQIEYDTRDNLIAAGVIPQAIPGNPRPRPFPANPGFVPDPPPYWR